MHQGERAFLVQRVSCTSILVLQLYVYAYFTCYVLYVCTCYLVTGRRGVLVWAAPLGGFFMLCYVALLFAVVVMLIRIQLYSSQLYMYSQHTCNSNCVDYTQEQHHKSLKSNVNILDAEITALRST